MDHTCFITQQKYDDIDNLVNFCNQIQQTANINTIDPFDYYYVACLVLAWEPRFHGL